MTAVKRAGPALTLSLVDGFALVASWDQLMRERFIPAIDRAAERPGFFRYLHGLHQGALVTGHALFTPAEDPAATLFT